MDQDRKEMGFTCNSSGVKRRVQQIYKKAYELAGCSRYGSWAKGKPYGAYMKNNI
jgi:hypothetical protein